MGLNIKFSKKIKYLRDLYKKLLNTQSSFTQAKSCVRHANNGWLLDSKYKRGEMWYSKFMINL